MPDFRVTVKRDPLVPGLPLLVVERVVKSQNAAHAAAAGLSLVGGNQADVIEVRALAPLPGRPALTTFTACAQGVYGFCYGSRKQPKLKRG
ncbi:MAG TPA: hypothetical protein VGM01_15355 [Ktedonobacteraceae bacterium]|jgi:hypothetical protein